MQTCCITIVFHNDTPKSCSNNSVLLISLQDPLLAGPEKPGFTGASVKSDLLLLQDAASVQQAAVPIMRELVKNANIFLVTHVIDDVGEATVRGALEDVGLVGTSEGQIKPHRLVFCSTLEGKVSIVRQLEPELHIDGHPSTVCF